MKKWTHLLVFTILSGISALVGLYGVFFGKLSEKDLAQLGTIPDGDTLVAVLKATNALQTGLISRVLVVLLFVLLVAIVLFLVRKQEELASYTYMGYLFVTLIRSTYGYVGGKNIAQLHTDAMMRSIAEKTALFGYLGMVALFALFFGLTVFFHFRKPKPQPPVTGNDI